MLWELTFTLKPYLYNSTAREQYNMTYAAVLAVLCGFKTTVVAELTSAHNIHYHAMLDFEGIQTKDRIINRIRMFKVLGKPHLSPVQYEESYKNYIKEDVIETTSIICADAVLKDDYDIFHRKGAFLLKTISPSKPYKPITE